MSRKIKFHAWDKVNKCMKVVSELDFLYEKSQKMTWGMQGALTDVWLNGEDESYIPSDVILLQFTGEKDPNYTEVYESDIIEWITDPQMQTKRCGVVRFRDGMYEVYSNGATVTLSAVISWGGVVIGNEFDNGELLEASNE